MDLSTEGNQNSKDKNPSKKYINTKVVNLDLFSSSESLTTKNLNQCKSEKLIEYKELPELKKKKYTHVPTVETKLYSDQTSQDNNERQVSRNNSLNKARSQKRKVASSSNDSLNESQDSLSEKYNMNSLNQQLNEIKSVNKKKSDKDERSVSPVTINYKSFGEKVSSTQVEKNKRTYSNDTRNVHRNEVTSSNNIFTFNPARQNVRFLNFVRSQKKKEDQEY